MNQRNQPTDRDGKPVRHGTQDKINRLRERLDRAKPSNPALAGVIAGIIDLLEDEL